MPPKTSNTFYSRCWKCHSVWPRLWDPAVGAVAQRKGPLVGDHSLYLDFSGITKKREQPSRKKNLEVAVLVCKVGQNKWGSWREHRDGGEDQSTHKGVGQEGAVFLSGDEDLDMALHRNGKETVGDLQARS